jgi:NTP pyrophosphatase (non-canonical NTP hydrolase)
MTTLTFADVTAANRSRASRWHPGYPDDADWTVADWSNAMCGEAGELANVIKKLRRYEFGLRGAGDPTEDDLRAMAAKEVADVYLYLDLLATKLGVDLPAAVVAKFNEVSERQGFPERLP